MKAMLLRVGIDKSSDGILSPIFPDGTFEYIPLSENTESNEIRTYHDVIGRKGKPLSAYLPPDVAHRKVHLDPEFTTFTYGDTGRKSNYLRKLNPEDLLVFYAGLTPYNGSEYPEALYIIGYFTVKKIWGKNNEPGRTATIRVIRKKYPTNSHPQRVDIKDMALVVGNPEKSKLLEKGILISQKKLNKIGRRYHAVSPPMEKLLGIKGSIQRSIPPRLIYAEHNLGNLKKLLGLNS
ncbi:MAG: hypothetical protein KO316_04280 [Methanobacterium sp.]|jgi:hypothetical protein|nr:hypothetical protein [Methanobacterium sp.]